MKNICLVLALMFVLAPILAGCGGGDSLPYVGPIDERPPSDGTVTPTPPDDGIMPPPPPGNDEPDTDLQPPGPPIF